VKFLETFADNVFRHNYSMMQIKKKNYGKILGLPRSTPLKPGVNSGALEGLAFPAPLVTPVMLI